MQNLTLELTISNQNVHRIDIRMMEQPDYAHAVHVRLPVKMALLLIFFVDFILCTEHSYEITKLSTTQKFIRYYQLGES